MSVLNNQKELGGQQRCPMGLVGHPIDCRTQIVVVHTLLAVVPALKLDLLALRVHVLDKTTSITAPLHGQAGLLGSNHWLPRRYSGEMWTWRPHRGAGGLPTAR